MELTLRHLYLLARYGYSQFEVAALDENDQTKLLNALDRRDHIETYDSEVLEDEKEIWGLGPAK